MGTEFLVLKVYLFFLALAEITHVANFEAIFATSADANLVLNDATYFEIVEPEQLRYTFKLRPARDFGGVFRYQQRQVDLQFAEPLNGCSALTSAHNGAVAFIMRGGCSFLTKTLNAEKAKYIGAIISDSDEDNDGKFVDMIDDDTQRKVNIPSFFLVGKDGAMIRQMLSGLHIDRAIINIPVNLTGVPLGRANQPPWTLW